MQSHAYVERIEDGIAVLEVRLTPKEYVPENAQKRFKYPRKQVQLPVEDLTKVISNVKARDVLVVEQTDGSIEKICYLDEVATKQRFERAEARRQRLKEKMQKI